MKSKKSFMSVISIVSILVFIIAGCGSSASNNSEQNGNSDSGKEQEVVTLKVATYFAGTSPVYTAFTEPWMKRVTELTNGKVQFDYYPSEQLGKAGDLLRLTKDGVTDLSVYPAAYVPDQMPLTNMLAGFPNLSTTAGQGTLAYNDLLKESKELLEIDYLKNGVRPIMPLVSTTYELWTKDKAIRVPEDLKGMKVRTPGGVANKLYEYLNATPVAVAFPEIYEAIDKGVIDAVSMYSMGMVNGGLDEITTYAVFPHIGSAIQGLMINENTWKNLSKETQDAMMQAGQEVIEAVGDVYLKETNAFNESFVKNGGTIVELTEEEQEKWLKETEKFTQYWLDQNKSEGLPYDEILNLYKEELENYE